MAPVDKLRIKPWLGVGIMSGTSLDGVDACLVSIISKADAIVGSPQSISASVIGTHSIDIPSSLRDDLFKLQTTNTTNLKTLLHLEKDLAQLYSKVTLELLKNIPNICRDEISAIGCHGQTVAHHPSVGTLQLGDPNILAELTQLPVISHFRQADMAAGGQGAPLVPFAEALLFAQPKQTLGLLNIGGIANITLLPQLTKKTMQQSVWAQHIQAFDTGPGNMLIDAAAHYFYQQPFDTDGHLARRGKVSSDLLAHIRSLDTFARKAPPKSTGRDDYGAEFFKACLHFQQDSSHKLSADDWLATFTEYTALCLSDSLVQTNISVEELWISGGGALNSFLLERIQHHLPKVGSVIAMPNNLCDPQYKEAFCFAILAWAYQEGIPANIPSVTGASHPCQLGRLSLPNR